MKKVMIGILILVPILIVLIIAMVSTILTAAAYISVEKINLDYNDGYSNPLTLNLSDEVYNLNKYFNISVEPAKATDKDYVWKIEGLQCFDTDYQKRYDEYVTAYAEYVAYREAHKNDVGFVDNGFKGDVVAPAAMLVAVDEDGNYVKDELGNYVEVSESKVGRLRINSYCAFDIVVVLQNFSARANIYVTGFDVTAATIAGKDNIKVGESALLTAQAQPVDSIIKKIIWQSSNEAVATVDKNGVVKGLTAGTATITAKLKKYDATTDEDKDYVVSSAFTLTVGASVSRYGASYTTHLSELSASELALVNPTATTNCTISGDTITLTGGTATIQTDGGLFTIYRCGENDIVISDVEVFGFDSQNKHNFVLSVGDLPLLLNARYKSMDKVGSPTVTWTTSAKEVATVENGTITGVGSGRVEITAKTATETATIDLLVQKKISMVILGTTNEKLAVGIARQTVYGSRVFADTSLTSKFDKKVNNKIAIDFVLPVAPLPTASAEEKAIFYSAFTFAVTGEDKKPSDLAYFERYSNVLVFDADKIAATGVKSRIKLTVTVTAKYPKYESTTSYTVKTVDIYVVDGVHITSDATDAQLKEPTMKIVDKMVDGKKVQTVVVDEDERVEFQKYNMPLYNQLFALAKEGNDMRNANIDAYNNGNMYFPAITLGKNIRWPDKGEESINWYVYSRLELFGDLYGNNMRIAAGFREIASSIELMAVRDTADNLISNVTLRANTIPNGYEMTSSDKDSSNNLTAYSLGYERYDYNRYRSVRNRIEYSILENNRSCIGIRSADVTVDGCIMRNTTQAAIFIPTEINDLNDDKGTADTNDD
ncbi:MAG: Ig-like domain-containing protein, partial [Clostridia bacterium]